MRINYVWIENYNNLKNFDIFFNDKSSLDMIIGENGSGKTNFLMSLLRIYKDLYTMKEGYKKDEEVKHRFSTINYKLIYFDEDGNTIGVLKNNKNLNFFKISKEKNSDELISRDLTNSLFSNSFNVEFTEIISTLPRNIISYYSGTSSAMRSVLNQFNSSFKFQNKINNLPMEAIGNEILPFLFLCNSIELNAKNDHRDNSYFEDFYKTIFNIVGISSFSISFREEVYWKEDIELKLKFKLLNILKKCFDRNDIEKNPKSFKFDKKNIHIFYQVLKEERIFSLDLFEMLLSLKKITKGFKMEIYFEKENQVTTMSYRNLSEGEKQFALILSILNLYKNEKTLFLLDEPDTFLHPRWQRELVNKIKCMKSKSNIIFTTHSPLALSELENGNINLFRNSCAEKIPFSLYGLDSGYIQKIIMGVSDKSDYLENQISKFYDEIALKNIEGAKKELKKIENGTLSRKDPFFNKAKFSLKRLEVLENYEKNK